MATRIKKAALTSKDTPSPHRRTKHKRTVSWVDQVTNGPAKSHSPSSDVDLGDEQATHGSNDAQLPPSHREADTDSDTGSTLSLNSPLDSKASLVLSPPAPKVPQHPEDSALAASRNLSPFKGKPLWEPDDDEWADVDAHHIAETFKASFKDPGQYSPRKAGTLSRWGSTITSYLPLSPSKRAESQKLHEEEETRDNLEVLGNTYFCDPDGDLCDTVMKGVHLTGSEYFESSTSVRKPHIVDLEAYFKASDPLSCAATPRLSDAVATVLSHTNKECLEAFLDPAVDEFIYKRELDRNKAGSILVVRRKSNQIIAGAYRNLGFSMQWTTYVKSCVSITGQWHEQYATLKSGSTPILNGVPQWDMFFPVDEEPTQAYMPKIGQNNTQATDSSPRKIVLGSPHEKQEPDELSPKNPKFMLYQSRLLATYLLRDIWMRFDGMYECRATWEADGEVKEVRLRRALVGFGGDGE